MPAGYEDDVTQGSIGRKGGAGTARGDQCASYVRACTHDGSAHHPEVKRLSPQDALRERRVAR